MNRRKFLIGLSAVVAASALPALPEQASFSTIVRKTIAKNKNKIAANVARNNYIIQLMETRIAKAEMMMRMQLEDALYKDLLYG